MLTADLIINFSGGKDSTVMLAELCRLYPNHKKHVIFADTGWEHGAYEVEIQGKTHYVRDTEDWCRRVVELFDLELHTTRSSRKTYLSMVEARGMFPSAQYRTCTSDLKTSPIEVWTRAQVKIGVIAPNLVNCLGIRAAESSARAKKNPLKRYTDLDKAGRKAFTWYPIFNWETEAIYQYLVNNNLPLHSVYRRAGGHLDRFSCRHCIFNTPRELAAIRLHDPATFETIRKLEIKIDHTVSPTGRTIVDLADEWERKVAKRLSDLEAEEKEPQQICMF